MPNATDAILKALTLNPGLRPHQIPAATGLPKRTITKALQILRQANSITRHPGLRDARSQHYYAKP